VRRRRTLAALLLMLGGCLACASAPASKVTPPARPAPRAPTLQPAPTGEAAAARLARQKTECERDYGEMEPRTAVEAQFEDSRVLKELAARCGSHLRARWERELSNTTGDDQDLAWRLLEVYPALEGADRERELERLAELANTFAKAPNAPPIWQARAAMVRARMMAPRCDAADVRTGIEFLRSAWSTLQGFDLFPTFELATQLSECRKLLPATDPLVVEAAAKSAWVYWAFGQRSENPVRQQELLGRAIAEATFVFEQRHRLFPKETPSGLVLHALVASLHQLKRTPEALQWFDLLLADARFLAAEPEFAEALKEIHFDFVYDYAGDLTLREPSRADLAQCTTLLSQLLNVLPKKERQEKTDRAYFSIGYCHEEAGQHLLADKAWSAVKSSGLRDIIEQRRAARKSPSP